MHIDEQEVKTELAVGVWCDGSVPFQLTEEGLISVVIGIRL